MTDYIKREDETGYIKKADAIRLAVRESTECVIGDDYTEADSARVGEAVARVIYALQTMLPADVAPVRHGRWIVGEQMPMHDIKGNLSWGNWYTCNQCEFKTYAIERHITQYNYCPNCGAKMDEEAEK